MSVTYTATLPVREHTVLFLSGLLHAERQRLGTRAGTRSLGCFKQAVLVLRWLLDATKVKQLALDNTISVSTGYAYLHEGITVLAAQAPALPSALLAAKMAGYAHVTIDGTLIETDRCRTPGPTPGVAPSAAWAVPSGPRHGASAPATTSWRMSSTSTNAARALFSASRRPVTDFPTAGPPVSPSGGRRCLLLARMNCTARP